MTDLILGNLGGGIDTTERVVLGKITRLDADRVYVVIPSFHRQYEFGPIRFEHAESAAIGDAVLVGFDETGQAWVIGWDGVPLPSAGGAAGGHLTGTYPNPSIAPSVVTDAMIATANKDGAAATPSMRTLGTGASQAAAGDHLHDGRYPLLVHTHDDRYYTEAEADARYLPILPTIVDIQHTWPSVHWRDTDGPVDKKRIRAVVEGGVFYIDWVDDAYTTGDTVLSFDLTARAVNFSRRPTFGGTGLLRVNEKAADSELLDGINSTQFQRDDVRHKQFQLYCSNQGWAGNDWRPIVWIEGADTEGGFPGGGSDTTYVSISTPGVWLFTFNAMVDHIGEAFLRIRDITTGTSWAEQSMRSEVHSARGSVSFVVVLPNPVAVQPQIYVENGGVTYNVQGSANSGNHATYFSGIRLSA